MELETALRFVNDIVIEQAGRKLRSPEETIFKGTWQGMTYEQMANFSSYSANYLMRDIAPKFWRLLSELVGENVGKSNLRIIITKLYGSPETNIAQPLKLEAKKLNSTVLSIRDWGKSAPTSSKYYGNRVEILQDWIVKDKCRMLGLWGLAGSGKTASILELGKRIQERFEVLIWRSLDTAPTLNELLADLLESGFSIVEQDSSLLLPRFIEQMRSHSCLILLENIEAILQSNTFSGKYLPGYEDYEMLFRVFGESSHKSTLVFTSLENPNSIIRITGQDPLVRYLKSSGLSTSEAKSLIEIPQLTSQKSWQNLIAYYQGNPAMIIFAVQTIRELFNGVIDDFLAQRSLVFGEIARLLAKSLSRLSPLETEILYWLATVVKPMSLKQIQQEIPLSIYPVELIEALKSLSQRALIETSQLGFSLQPMIREVTIDRFIANLSDNFSLENRGNSMKAEKTIELGIINKKPTHLSQWLKNNFESSWQSVEILFTASGRSPARLRSAFSFRGETVVKRFKQIKLATKNPTEILLVIAIAPEQSAYQICVQAQPAPQQQILPDRLELNLIDKKGNIIAKIASEEEDNFIQLPYFRGAEAEEFKVGLNLDAASYEEDFLI